MSDPHATSTTLTPSAAGPPSIRPEEPGRPAELRFEFAQQSERIPGAIGMSLLLHAMGFLGIALFIRYAPQALPENSWILGDRAQYDVVWLNEPGPGGGGGGGGNRMPTPPRKAELPGKDRTTVPVAKPPELQNPVPKDEPPSVEQLAIPARAFAAGDQILPGTIDKNAIGDPASQGPGSGGGAGTGRGTGIGPGDGPGLGPGSGGGFGGGAYRPGSGIELPVLIREVKPQYTADAMRAKIQGVVLLEAVVLADGTVGDIRVTRSLDPVFGLDQEAVKAARQWRFIPGKRQGQPVAVLVTIELMFTLR